MSTKKVIDVADPDVTPATVRVEIRGQVYKFREVEIGEYNTLVGQATHEEEIDGEMQEVVDNTLLLRLLILRSSVTPKLTPDWKPGARLYRAIAGVVNELHYGSEPVKQLPDEDDESPADEETPKGNA